MPLRTLYLHATSSAGARDALAGGKLYEGLRVGSGSFLTASSVLPPEFEGSTQRAATSQNLICSQRVREFNPNLIYIEGGLFTGSRVTWKIPWPLVENLVENGGVLIVADCGTPELRRYEPEYHRAARFLRARAEIPLQAPGANSGWADGSNGDSEFVCDAERMIVSRWLRPAVSGVSHVAVRNPARLKSWDGIAASQSVQGSAPGQRSNLGGVLEETPWVFASAAQCGCGFVLLIAGEVSSKEWMERYPSNAIWLMNLVDLLVAEAEHNKARAVCPTTTPFSLFLSHRSVNKQLAVRVGKALHSLGARVLLDGEPVVSTDSLIHENGRSPGEMTHFVLFWSRACLGAPWVERELVTAVSMAVERRVPVLVVRLDMTPVPQMIGDSFRIEGMGMSPQEIAEKLMQAVRRMERNGS